MLDGKQLRARYQFVNAKYFGSRLPPYAIPVVKHVTWLNEGGRCHKNRRVIEILAGQSDEESIGTLRHEMAHAASNEAHKTREAGNDPPPLVGCTSPWARRRSMP
jgi:hypothetical protein